MVVLVVTVMVMAMAVKRWNNSSLTVRQKEKSARYRVRPRFGCVLDTSAEAGLRHTFSFSCLTAATRSLLGGPSTLPMTCHQNHGWHSLRRSPTRTTRTMISRTIVRSRSLS